MSKPRPTYTTAEIRARDLQPGDVFMINHVWREVLDVWTGPEDFDPTGWPEERAALVMRYLRTEAELFAVIRYLDEWATFREGRVVDDIVSNRLINLVTIQVPAYPEGS